MWNLKRNWVDIIYGNLEINENLKMLHFCHLNLITLKIIKI